ncbi:16561_t:CDS:2 [Entrophospora sp. SA101]|nr:16561_t:CDS:2 [Entrophospora sp. SA101]
MAFIFCSSVLCALFEKINVLLYLPSLSRERIIWDTKSGG